MIEELNVSLAEIERGVKLCGDSFHDYKVQVIPFFKTCDDAQKFIDYLEPYLVMKKLTN
jgi:hypothetical protein